MSRLFPAFDNQPVAYPVIRTIADALAAHDAIPAHKRNNNCVQDAQWRLRDAIKLARSVERDEEAPSYVVKAVANLRSWL